MTDWPVCFLFLLSVAVAVSTVSSPGATTAPVSTQYLNANQEKPLTSPIDLNGGGAGGRGGIGRGRSDRGTVEEQRPPSGSGSSSSSRSNYNKFKSFSLVNSVNSNTNKPLQFPPNSNNKSIELQLSNTNSVAPRVATQAQFLANDRNAVLEYISNTQILGRKNRESQNTVLTVGYLTAIKGELKDKQGLAISGAITMALDEINNNPDILPNVTLALRWNDTKGDTVLATRALTEMICDGVSSFFGPEGPCHVEAIVSQSRNIPMISYKCSDYITSPIPTFARTEPPDTQVTKSIISLLNYYTWKRFSIIHEEMWTTVANSLKEQAESRNMTINHCEKVIDNHKCCENEMECCRTGYWYQVVQNTMNRTRIYVFLGPVYALVNMMEAMDAMKLFSNGEYMVIFVDMMTYSAREAQKYIWKPDHLNKHRNCEELENFKQRARSLLVIVSSPPAENYENFTERVREYNKKEPFHFSTPSFFNVKNYIKFVSIYAAYLYDSVMLYALALDKLLRNETRPLTEEVIRDVASNGTRIVETIINNKTYKSVTGATIKIDKHGDSEGNFSVLALKEQLFVQENFTCNYHMVPIGYFHQGEDFPEYKINTSIKIDWPGEDRPYDMPTCGYENKDCSRDDNQITSLVTAGVLALVLFCAGVIVMSIYRKWKIELEIEGLLWRIESNEIKGYFGNDIVSSPSKLSLASAASFGSRCSNQVFTSTAQFRGVVTRIKELKFSKKKDISREIMKEMRLLRDLRHDNVNSFIGACVEPMRILLVTDYCAKGSLYDIIENEDIKLDDIFIASLVHDLIKGMIFIHNSALIYHGNLKSSNCVVTSRWLLQVTDFGLHDLRHCAENESIGEHQHYRNQFWKAPELLRRPEIYGNQKGDIYAFAIILYEIISRKGPFGQTGFEPKEIIDLVKHTPDDTEIPFRPDLECIEDMGICPDYVLMCIQDCWNENPELRPEFSSIRNRLKKMRGGKSKNIMDQMMEIMEKYTNNLEEIVSERTRLLCEEKRKTEDLLHRMLPQSVAEKLTRGHGVEPVSYDSVTIYFSDIVGFTAMSAESTPLQVVNFLNDLYTVFDRVIKGYDVYKVETIGDAYMVVSGLPIKNGDRHVGEIASMALELLEAVKTHKISHRPNETLKLRIGMHTGPVVAGVVGLTMPRYCLFGDTVNTASRMESNGEALKIHISGYCKSALDRLGGYVMEMRGAIHMKGKGEVVTYWLVGATENAIQKKPVDLEDLPPPLFSRPRKSPKCESRQPSLIGGSIFNCPNNTSCSRRQSQVHRMDGESLQGSIVHNNHSPRSSQRGKLNLNDGSRQEQMEMASLTNKKQLNSFENVNEEEELSKRLLTVENGEDLNRSMNKKPIGAVKSLIADEGASDKFKSFNEKHTSFDPSNLIQLRESRSLDRFPPSEQRNRRMNFRRLTSKLTMGGSGGSNSCNSSQQYKSANDNRRSACEFESTSPYLDEDHHHQQQQSGQEALAANLAVPNISDSNLSCSSNSCCNNDNSKVGTTTSKLNNGSRLGLTRTRSHNSSNKLLAAIPSHEMLDLEESNEGNDLRNGDKGRLLNCNGLNNDVEDQNQDNAPLLDDYEHHCKVEIQPQIRNRSKMDQEQSHLEPNDDTFEKKWRSMDTMNNYYFDGGGGDDDSHSNSRTGSGILKYDGLHPGSVKGKKHTNFEDDVKSESSVPSSNPIRNWILGIFNNNNSTTEVGGGGGQNYKKGIKQNNILFNNHNNNNNNSNKNKNHKRFNLNSKLTPPVTPNENESYQDDFIMDGVVIIESTPPPSESTVDPKIDQLDKLKQMTNFADSTATAATTSSLH